MALESGSRLGPYEIAALIGVGGMGEVYRARDTTLGRDVAIKVLPESFSNDAMRVTRFQQEAKTLALLNHSNIAHIYGLERSSNDTAIVMELVDGMTLMDRIAQGPLPVEEALKIAGQLADALEAAHERGVVHRDLKPANIKLKSDGTVKVLDFGIAKALDANATGTTPATQTGVVLGTPAYMSPEQARGKSVDKRADIWAFGCLLYEMLSGRPAFEDDDVTLKPARLRESGATAGDLAMVPPAVRQTIKLCLEPDIRKRIRDIGDARLALEGAFETATPPATGTTRGRWAWPIAFAIAALASIAFGVPALRHFRESPPLETRVDIVTPASDDPNSFALSPDGRQLVFAASGTGGARLWLRSFITNTVQPLPGTEGAISPFWSPDSRSIGFFAQGALRRLDLGSTAPQRLAAAVNGAGGTWNADGVIVFAPSVTSALMRISAGGGVETPVFPLGPDAGHTSPYFLPDGFRFLYSNAQGPPDTTGGIYIGALDGRPPTRLTSADGDALYVPPGWLLWVRQGVLVAQRLDLAQPALTGAMLSLADGLEPDAARSRSAISVAEKGLIAYRASGGSKRQLMWVDRSGTMLGTVGASDSDNLRFARLTPDGRLAVVSRSAEGNTDLWQLGDGRTSRITFDPGRDDYPEISPDGISVTFRSTRSGPGDLYKKFLGRADPEELLLRSNELKTPTDWSADGRFLLFSSNNPDTSLDLWVLPMQGEPYVFLRTSFREHAGVFSPDGQWVAYHSRESGREEVYIRRFFDPIANRDAVAGDQWQISTTGGVFPTWSANGQEVYYLDPTGAMMAVPISVAGSKLTPGIPEMLFPTRISRGGQDVQQGRQYDVSADGRFLINIELDDDVGTPITLIQNWNPDAKR